MLWGVHKIRHRIFANVLFFVCASVFAILISSFYIFEQIEYEDKKDALLKRQELITQSQAIIVPQFITEEDEEAVALTLTGALSNPSIVGVAIHKPDGQALYRFGDFESADYQLFEMSQSITTFDGSAVRLLGRLMTVSTDRYIVESMQQRRLFYALVFALLFVVIVVAVFASIHSIVAVPLNRLVSAIKKSQDGHSISVGWSGSNEIGLVVKEFENLQARQFQAQSKLQDSEIKFRDFAASSSDWFWEMDEDLRFTYFSERFTEITGVPRQALLGKTRPETGNPGVDEETWRQYLADLAAHRPFRDFQHPRKHPDRGTVFLSISGKPVFDQRGRFRGYRGTGTDITERKRAEETLQASERALQERVADLEEAQHKLEMQGRSLALLADDLLVARDEARAADRAKSEFLAAMSHELRTPLNAIIGFSEVIKREAFGPVGSQKYIEYTTDIYESGQHLLGLINDILDLSKVESGSDELHEDEIHVAEIVQAALRLVNQRAEEGGVEIATALPDQLPTLRADERKLKQILVNLLSNAVKFTEAGGVVTVKVWCREDSGYVFQIADTGIGIAPKDIPKAFSQFGQVDGDLHRQYEGTGLGLPLTKALIELHGGALDLQSKIGAGTTVTVRFPVERILALPGNSTSLGADDRAAG